MSSRRVTFGLRAITVAAWWRRIMHTKIAESERLTGGRRPADEDPALLRDLVGVVHDGHRAMQRANVSVL